MRSFEIGANDAGQRLDKFTAKAAPLLPQSLMYKYIRLKRIKVNSKRAEISTRLSAGDVVDMYIDDSFFAPREDRYDFMTESKNLDVAYEDGNILVLDKKPGLLCHPDAGQYSDTLIGRVKRYLYEKGEYDPSAENSFVPALANRIDRNTGGLVLAAKNAAALRVLNEAIRVRDVKKLYLCVTVGVPKKKEGILAGYITKDEKSNTVSVSGKREDGAKTAKLSYRVLDSKNGLSLVEVDLLTGRTHQIRAQFAGAGTPLLGDGKYGRNEANKANGGYRKQLLYSYSLTFLFEKTEAGLLSYLAGKTVTAGDVWFVKAFNDGTLKGGGGRKNG